MHAGDVLVIWKLDRLGRSLRDLVNLVGTLMEKGIGLQSLQDPIDTTSSQGRLVFNIFASLAEFERDLIVERTRAGLNAARARGRRGGRPKGLSVTAQKKAIAAEALYKEGRLGVKAIAENLGISKATLYKYLRHRGVQVGPFRQSTQPPQPKTLKVTMHLVVENNSKFVRGKETLPRRDRAVRPLTLWDAQTGYAWVRLRTDDSVRERSGSGQHHPRFPSRSLAYR